MPLGLTVVELANKLYYKRQVWFDDPKIYVLKQEGSRFGHIVFDFNDHGENDPGEIKKIGVLFSSEEDENDDSGLTIRTALLMAEEVVENFSAIISGYYFKDSGF